MCDKELQKKQSTIKPNKQNKRRDEQLTEQELLELMGVYRQTYKRVNRRVKKK